MAERIVTGVRSLDRKLKRLARKSANKAARSGLGKGARLGAKLVKKEIPSKQKGIRKAIGSSVKKAKGGANKGITQAKFGTAGKRKASATAAENRDKRRPGVGISSQNVHWWITGTAKRTQKKTGRNTGKMPAHPVVKDAMKGGLSQVKKAVIAGTKAAIVREMKKK